MNPLFGKYRCVGIIDVGYLYVVAVIGIFCTEQELFGSLRVFDGAHRGQAQFHDLVFGVEYLDFVFLDQLVLGPDHQSVLRAQVAVEVFSGADQLGIALQHVFRL